MTPEELNSFLHGMRVQRIAMRMTQHTLGSAVRGQGVRIGVSTLGTAETRIGGFSVLSPPEVRTAICHVLGVAESVLISIGRDYVKTVGCEGCARWPGPKRSCGPWAHPKRHQK